ncbi:MAG: DnaB-like helicase C-terminal domain-containing protein, partial [bacterium]
MEKIVQQLKLHKITIQEAATEVNSLAVSIDRPDAFSDSKNWAEKAIEYLSARKKMYEENRMLTWPPMFKTLRERMPEIEPGILACVIAQSGVGKSMFISQMVDHWALAHKHNILNCSTELPAEILLWRRVSKFINEPLDRIKRGLVDQKIILECLEKYKNGGEIRDYSCAGATVDQVIKNAHNIKGHIMIDYFDMLDLSRNRMFGKSFDSSKTDAVGYALTSLKEYATSEKKVVWVVLQTGKEAAPRMVDGKVMGEQKLKLENGMDSVRFRHRANLGIALNFPIVTHQDSVVAPASKRKI